MNRAIGVLLALGLALPAYGACRPGIDPNCPPGVEPPLHRHHFSHGVRPPPAPDFTPSLPTTATTPASAVVRPAAEGPPAPTVVRLTPVRAYLSYDQIPPAGVAGYGMLALQYKPTDANRAKLGMICSDFVKFFPKAAASRAPRAAQMITIWPIEADSLNAAERDDCDIALEHYDLDASQDAISDARYQGETLEGEGPYLIGWAPSETRGVLGKLVLVVDFSDAATATEIDRRFLFWKDKIVEDPSIWRGGFSLERVRHAIADFADQYGQDILSAIKIVSDKGG